MGIRYQPPFGGQGASFAQSGTVTDANGTKPNGAPHDWDSLPIGAAVQIQQNGLNE